MPQRRRPVLGTVLTREHATEPREPSTPAHDRTLAAPIEAKLRRARLTLAAAYAANGLLLSTWFSRLPSVADRLGIPTNQLGVITISLTIATLIATPVAAKRLSAWRATRIVRIASPLTALALLAAVAANRPWQLASGLFVLGMLNGILGVGLNAQGTTLSRLAGRSWMPAMLGAASAAGVLGAAIGTVATAQRIALLPHVSAVCLVCFIVGLAVSRQIPIGGGTSSVRIVSAAARHTAHRINDRRRRLSYPPARRRSHRVPSTTHRSLNATLTGRVPRAADLRATAQRLPKPSHVDSVTRLLIGAALGATVAEGALANFGIVLFRDVIGVPISIAAMAFTVFSIAMAIVRLCGEWLTERLGPWLTLSAGGTLAAACGVDLSLRPPMLLAFLALTGVAVGIGCAVPVTFQLGTSHARAQAERVGVDPDRPVSAALSRIGLATAGGYLSGGPVVGVAAAAVGLRTAVLIVAVGGAAMAACAAALTRLIARDTGNVCSPGPSPSRMRFRPEALTGPTASRSDGLVKTATPVEGAVCNRWRRITSSAGKP